MKRKLICLTAFSFLFSACRHTVSETKPPDAGQTRNTAAKPIISPTVSPSATPDESKIKTYNGKGVVTKINLELVSVELDHEEIKEVMPPMKMEFYVAEKRELESLKVGDKVDFVLEDNHGQEKILSIRKEK